MLACFDESHRLLEKEQQLQRFTGGDLARRASAGLARKETSTQLALAADAEALVRLTAEWHDCLAGD
jgi:hypothetical protein